MVAFACSELASISFEMDIELIEEIGMDFDHDLVELSNFIVSNAFEKCCNTLPHSLAINFLEDEMMEPDEHLLSYVFFDYDRIKTHNLDTSLTQS